MRIKPQLVVAVSFIYFYVNARIMEFNQNYLKYQFS